MWWVVSILSAVGFAYASAEGLVKPANFDVANALLQHNVDISTVPGLANHSSSGTGYACSIAVSPLHLLIAYPN